MGYDDVVDKTSDAYRYGGYAGQAVSIALMAVTPVGWAKVAARGLNMVTTLGGGVQAAKAAAEGDFEAAGKLLVQTAVGRLAGRGAPCNAFTQAGKRVQKALWAANTVEQSSGAVEKLASGLKAA